MKVCKYYLTYACNSRCSYCNIWQNKDKATLTLEENKERLEELRKLGVTYVDFTGGEPMLYKDFIELLKYAKSLGMKVEFTTNGFAFDKYIDEASKYIDYPNISLDTLKRENYIAIRGIDGLKRAKNIAGKLGKMNKNAKIICVVTEKNIDEIPKLLKLAQKKHIRIYFSPLFSYFEEINNKYDDSKYGKVSLEKMFFEPYSMIALHFIEFFKAIDPEKYPICMCNEDVITLGPNGQVISPCYYYKTCEIGNKDQSLIDIVNSDEFKQQARLSGSFSQCKGCTAIPYLGFSFEYKLYYISLLSIFSDNYQKIKVNYLNDRSEYISLDIDELNAQYSVLRDLISGLGAENDNKHLLYSGEKVGNNIQTQLFRRYVSPLKYFFDNLSFSIWELNCMPFNFVEDIEKLLPHIRYKALKNKSYYELLEKFPMFYISWWIFYCYKRYNVNNIDIDISKYENVIREYLKLLSRKIRNAKDLQFDLSYDIEKFEIMCKTDDSYVTLKQDCSSSDKTLTQKQINSIVSKCKSNRWDAIIKFIFNINKYRIETINALIEAIKTNLSKDQIRRIKDYINVYRYHDDYAV